MRGTMNRRFVNLLVTKSADRRPAFNLHRIDPAGLFYPTGPPEPAEPAAMRDDAPPPAPARLPPAAISFDWPRGWGGVGFMDFMAFRNDVVIVDHMGRTVLYGAASHDVRTMNMMTDPRPSAISVTAGGGLYSLDIRCGKVDYFQVLRCGKVDYFQVLSYGRPFRDCWPEDWHWRPLLQPPIDYDAYDVPFYHDYDETSVPPHPCKINAHTVVGDSQIWISTVGAGTYSLDTASGVWSKAGEWALPFKGRAVYVPKHGLCFGFSDRDRHLWAADLPATSTEKPVLRHMWEEPAPPEAWIPMTSHLLPLGSGKLCVVRLYETHKRARPCPSNDYMDRKTERLAVLAGVELVKDDYGAGSLQMIKHMSKSYHFKENKVKLL